MKKRCELLDLLRVLAILLVLNSHFDSLYPISALATGGAAGNGLFFIISGYCLSLRPGFLHHMGRRIVRLYPGVLISFGIQLLLGMKHLGSVTGFISQCIWPTAFWFVGAIILFDALIWWLDKLNFTKHMGVFTAAMLVLYFAAYLLIVDKTKWSVEDPGLATPGQCFKLIYCFYIYALGYCLKKRGLPQRLMARKGLLIALTAVMFVGSFAFKLILVKWPATMPLQFLTQFMVIAFTFGALLCAMGYEENYAQLVDSRLRKAVTAFSTVSLEMYLVQFPVISLCAALPFPVNVLVVLAVTAALAFLLHAADERIFRMADRGLNSIIHQNGKKDSE